MARPGLTERFWKKVDRSAGLFGCWYWRGAHTATSTRNQVGRPVFWVGYCPLPGETWKTAPQLLVSAARMVLSLTDGVPLHERQGLEACHRPGVCDDPVCINPAHLYWGTPDQNRWDRYPHRTPAQAAADLRETLDSI